MDDHLKPLFNRRLLHEEMKPYTGHITQEQRAFAAEWASKVASGGLDGETEKTLQGLFLTRIFDRVLGYRQVVDGANVYYMKPEHALKAVKSGKTPDAALGFFGDGNNAIRAVVELKAPGADLDAKQGKGYGQLTPVEQAFGYAAKLDGCRWVIVSNFYTIRLYRYGSGQSTCHTFKLRELADTERLEELLYLLGRDTLLGSGEADSSVDRLAGRTHIEEARITKEFYAFYKEVRFRLFDRLIRDNPTPDGTDAEDHQVALLEHAQKIIDRVLFICFCEDTGLLPSHIIRQALTTTSSGFVQVSRWQQLQGLFAAVDGGQPAMKINAYNGGLFSKDSGLDALLVADEVLDDILQLSDYDFETDLNVNILGHVFEQSISDLEAIRADIRGEALDRSKSKRKKHGVFYTPEYITRFIVARTVGGWLDERYAELHAKHYPKGVRKSNDREIALYDDYLDVLKTIKVVDPACGSGAFLVAAFDFLSGEYGRVNRMLADLRGSTGQIGLFDLDRQILQQNLFGVDLNQESVEITKLSLWLKTARPDKPLNNLDDNIKCGNSLITPVADDADETARAAFAGLPEDSRPFDWRAAFPEVFDGGGFHVVIGNPPYVRQEVLGPFKPYLEQHYASYHGVADLYVYFYEKGLRLLATAGKMAYIVSNKWFRAGYGEPLRRFFAEQTAFEEILDFGHAPIFEDADTFPCIVVCRRSGEGSGIVRVCPVPRDRDTELSLEQYVDEHAYPIPWSRYGAEAWSLEPPEVDDLMAKLRSHGVKLREFAGVKPYRGVLTGFNEAFLIDDATRLKLIREDPRSEEIIKAYLRGQDIKRWVPHWQNLWMIFTRRGIDIDAYPAIKAYLEKYRTQLEPCPADWDINKQGDWPGRKKGKYAWYEIQDSVDYWENFEVPKIVYQEIQFHPAYGISEGPLYGNNKVFLIPSGDRYLLACLCSPLMWWYNWRYLPHMKDEALSPSGYLMEELPIAVPDDELRAQIEPLVDELVTLTLDATTGQQELLQWLFHEYGVEKPGQKLEGFTELTEDDFIAEVRKRRPKGSPKLKPVDTTVLKKAHEDYVSPARAHRMRTTELERRLSDLVNQAYGLTEEEVELMWKTAPPRMPISR